MSSEALPLIFEPFEDVAEEQAAGAAAAVSQAPVRSPGAMETRLLPTSDADPALLIATNADTDGPSREPPVLLSDWTSPWQASGAELLEPVSTSGSTASQQQIQSEQEDHPRKGEQEGCINLKAKIVAKFQLHVKQTSTSFCSKDLMLSVSVDQLEIVILVKLYQISSNKKSRYISMNSPFQGRDIKPFLSGLYVTSCTCRCCEDHEL